MHEVSVAVVDCLQMGDALLKNSKTMKVNIRGSSTPKVRRIKIIGLGMVKLDEEGSNFTH